MNLAAVVLMGDGSYSNQAQAKARPALFRTTNEAFRGGSWRRRIDSDRLYLEGPVREERIGPKDADEVDPRHSYIKAPQTCPCNHHNALRRIKSNNTTPDPSERRRKLGNQMTPISDNWFLKSPADGGLSLPENDADVGLKQRAERRVQRSTSQPAMTYHSYSRRKELLPRPPASVSGRNRGGGGEERLQMEHGGGDAASAQQRVRGNSSSSRQSQLHQLPRCIQEVILHHHHREPAHRSEAKQKAKLMKSLSKRILLPEDPEDPVAFTLTPGFSRTTKKPWCSSKSVYKIVGSFALLMTIAILAVIIYVNYYSDMFRPMM